MSLRTINREQTWLLPPSIDELISDDHPARFIGTFVDAQEHSWSDMGISMEGEVLGAPAYHPRALLCVWLYGFMTGTRSSRKLETACRDQLPYLWLTGWQHPDHNTLWRFYKKNRDSFKLLFKGTVNAAIKLGMVDMAVQAVDGTKIMGNASKSRTYSEAALKQLLERTDAAIADLEAQNENESEPLPVYLPKKLAEKKKLKEAILAVIEKISNKEKTYPINLTDEEAKLMKGRQGIVPGYNFQVATVPLNPGKGRGQFIVAEDVVQDQGDKAQLIPMAEQAEENTGRKPGILLADTGYHSGENLETCVQKVQTVAIPEAQKALDKPYHKDRFTYNEETDSYLCPLGQTLKLSSKSRDHKKKKYRASATVCKKCPAFGECTRNSRHGRTIEIGPYESVLRKHREWMQSKEAKDIFRRRKTIVEPIFGILKEQQGGRRFLLRGLDKVRAEGSLLAATFNLRILYKVWTSTDPSCLTQKLINSFYNFLHAVWSIFFVSYPRTQY